MIVSEDAERMKLLLTEAITVLCKSGFNYNKDVTIEGLLGITFDRNDIMLININETFRKSNTDDQEISESSSLSISRSSVRAGQKKRKRQKQKAIKVKAEQEEEQQHEDSDVAEAEDDDSDADDNTQLHNFTDDPVGDPDFEPSSERTPKKRKASSLFASAPPQKRSHSNTTTKKDEDSGTSDPSTPRQPASHRSMQCVDLASLPEALKQFSILELRKIVVSVVRSSEVPEGVGYPGWGKEGNKPQWWPDDIPWTKYGVQRGVKRPQLERLVTEAMQFHGGQLPEPRDKKSKEVISPKPSKLRSSSSVAEAEVEADEESILVAEGDIEKFTQEQISLDVQERVDELGQQTLVLTAKPLESSQPVKYETVNIVRAAESDEDERGKGKRYPHEKDS